MKMSDVFELPLMVRDGGNVIQNVLKVYQGAALDNRIAKLICEAINAHDANIERIAELERKNTELRAHVERLKSLFEEGFNSGDGHDLVEWEVRAKRVIDETPSQSLAEIRARAVESAIAAYQNDYIGQGVEELLQSYADSIRKGDGG